MLAAFTTVALATASTSTTAASHTVTHVTAGKTYHFGKFTATPKITVDGTTYYEMVSEENGTYCISTNGNNTQGSDVVLEGCDTSNNNDMWAVGFWTGGSWVGYAYIYSKANTSLCLDDANGAENIRLPLHSCGEVGGMSWAATSTNEPSGGYCVWRNAINESQGLELNDITVDFGDQFDGAWIVMQWDTNVTGGGWNADQQFGGLDDWGGGCIDG